MAVIDYSQTGISARAIEEARKRRGRRAPYSPSVSGLSELDTERDVNAAATSDGDVQAAADPRRISALLRAPMSDLSVAQRPEGQGAFALREPMTGAPEATRPAVGIRIDPQPTPSAPEPSPAPVQKQAGPMTYLDPLDAQDRAQSERLRRQRLGLVFAGLGGAIFGDPATSAARNEAVSGAIRSIDPNAPLANIDERARARREQAEAERRMQIEDEDRALNADYRRTLMRSMGVNADRREAQMGRQSEADARLYDPTHPVAVQRREFLRRIIAGAPEIAEGMRGQDLDALGSADLRVLTDQMLRRIGEVPTRYRESDVAELMRVASELDAADGESPEVSPEPQPDVEPEVEETPRARAERIARARRGIPAPTPPATPAPQPSGLVDRRGQPAPWAGRGDRTVAQMNAERIIEREPNVRSWAEALAVARALERSRTREAGALAGGVDTRSREAQFQQTGQAGTFTEADVTRAARVMTPIMRQSRQLRGLIARVDQIDDATFRQAMQGGSLAALGFNAADFQAQWAAYSNPELRERSGAAVTDNEYQRFVQEFNAGRLNSREQFKRALQRVLAEVQANSRSFGLRPDVVQEVYRRGQRPQGGR